MQSKDGNCRRANIFSISSIERGDSDGVEEQKKKKKGVNKLWPSRECRLVGRQDYILQLVHQLSSSSIIMTQSQRLRSDSDCGHFDTHFCIPELWQTERIPSLSLSSHVTTFWAKWLVGILYRQFILIIQVSLGAYLLKLNCIQLDLGSSATPPLHH